MGRDQFCPQVLTLVASAASANRAGGFDLGWNTCGISNGDGWFVVKQAVDKRKLRKDHAMSLQGTLLYIMIYINFWYMQQIFWMRKKQLSTLRIKSYSVVLFVLFSSLDMNQMP